MSRVSTWMALATVSVLALSASLPAQAAEKRTSISRTVSAPLMSAISLEEQLLGRDNQSQGKEPVNAGGIVRNIEKPPPETFETIDTIAYRRYRSIELGCITLQGEMPTTQDKIEHGIRAKKERQRIEAAFPAQGAEVLDAVDQDLLENSRCDVPLDERQASFSGDRNPRRNIREGDLTDTRTTLVRDVVRDDQAFVNRTNRDRLTFDKAYDVRDWDGAIAVAAAYDQNMNDAQFDTMFGCENVANMWRAGEAYGERWLANGNKADQNDAFDHYDYIINQCADKREHLGTIARARPYVTDAQYNQLVDRAKERWPGDSTFLSKVDEISGRAADGSFVDPYAPIYTESRYSEVTPQMLSDYEKLANEALEKGEHDKAEGLAWYYYNQRDYKQAQKWFEKAGSISQSNSIKEGMALTDALMGNYEEAEKVAYENRNASEAAATLYTNIGRTILSRDDAMKKLGSAFLERFKTHVKDTRSVDGAVSLGWYYFQKKDYTEARSWFTFAEGLKQTDKGCEGLALSQRALKDSTGYKATAKYCSSRSTELKRLFDNLNRTGARGRSSASRAPGYKSTDTSKATRAYLEGDFSRCLDELNKFVDHTKYDVGVALQRGWCVLGLKRPTEAIALFNEAATLPTNDPRQVEVDTAFGRSLALLQKGLIDEAIRNAEYYRLDQKTLSELRAEALTQRANIAFESGDYEDALRFLEHRAAVAPLRRDLLLMQGWALYHMGNYEESLRLFTMLDRQMRSDETEEGIRVLSRASRKIYYD